MVVGVPLILEGESPITDVVEILEPLKVRHSHTTCIGIQVLGRVGGGRTDARGKVSALMTGIYICMYVRIYTCTLVRKPITVIPWICPQGSPCMTHRHDKPLPLSKNLVCVWHGGSIGALSDHLGLDVVSIGSSNDLLPGCRDKDVTLVLKEVVGGVLQGDGKGELLMLTGSY